MVKIFGAVVVILLMAGAAAAEVRVSAAASMTDAVKTLAEAFRRENPQIGILPNFGGSGALARQIDQGAPVDVFIAAHPGWMEYLVEQKKVAPESVRVLAGNRLVFVGRGGSAVLSWETLANLERIAIGSSRSVPAGQYAEQALRGAGVYEELAGQGKLVMAKDVRQALIYADRGEVDGAFVYRTDARLAQHAAILFEVPTRLHPPITYPVGLTGAGSANPEAVAFYEYLKSPQAKEILAKHGFVIR